MAIRRMFSKQITSSSEFMMMSNSAQNLYFHIGLHADDDGFCEIFTIMRMTDSKPDDLRALSERGFIYVLNEKICIVKDWHENNQLRKDRYKQSVYLKDRNFAEIYYMIMEEKIRDLDLYKAFLKDWQPIGNQRLPKCGTRLGKVRLGKERKIQPTPESSDELTYHEPEKETFNTKQKQFKKLGINYQAPKQTSKQKKAVERLKAIDRFKELAQELHGISFKGVSSDNKKIRAGFDRIMQDCDIGEYFDWWFDTGGDFWGYTPQGFISNAAINSFKAKDRKGIKKKEEKKRVICGIEVRDNDHLYQLCEDGVLKFNKLTNEYERV